MSSKDFEKAIVAVLRPAGFVRFRSQREWRRERGGFLEEVDLQRSRFAPLVTVNYAMQHQAARQCVDDVAGAASAGPMFPISRRIGEFLGPLDRWWDAEDPGGPAAVQDLIQTRLLPYFDGMQTVDPYIEELSKYFGGRWGTVVHRLELAVLLHMTGATDRARQLLADPPARIGADKQAGVAALRRHLFGSESAAHS